MTTDQICAHCTKSIDDERWVRLDGEFYHSACWPRRTPPDHDTAANIARLTGQVSELTAQRDNYKQRWQSAVDVEQSTSRNLNEKAKQAAQLTESLRKSDAQRDELQTMLTACEERETQQRERAKKAEERAGTAEFALRRKEQEAYSSDLHLRERVGVLEEVLRPFVEAHYWECHTQFGPSLKSNPWRRETIEAARTALRPAPPSNANIACDTAQGACACGAWHGAAGPTHDRCIPGRCEEKMEPQQCPVDVRTLAQASRSAPVDRDASVDALSRCGRCDGYDACVRCGDLAAIDRLRAELAAANEEIARLKADSGINILAASLVATDAAHVATTAKLGRAVAALRMAWDKAVPAVLPGSKGHIADAVIAVLADADSKAAGEAWQAMVTALRDHARNCIPFADPCSICDALAAVDARRGGGR